MKINRTRLLMIVQPIITIVLIVVGCCLAEALCVALVG